MLDRSSEMSLPMLAFYVIAFIPRQIFTGTAASTALFIGFVLKATEIIIWRRNRSGA
jgi:hypothetical protein